MSPSVEPSAAVIELYWIPLGAGERVVRFCGRVFEGVAALIGRRTPVDLYHSALVVRVPDGRFVIEMTPSPDGDGSSRGVQVTGPVGLRAAGRLRLFRYEIRCWKDGVIPDLAASTATVSIAVEPREGRRLLDLVRFVPAAVWGRDELHAGEMWNSNSIVSWLLESSDVGTSQFELPAGGRAPGWDAGITVARRSERASVGAW